MTIKDIKQEARRKLALNMHQAIMIYTVEFAVMITLIALVVMSCVSLGVSTPAAIVMICYGILLGIIAMVGAGMVNFALVDFYLATYRCKPYNIRRLGDTLARSNITKVLLLSLKRTIFTFLLLLCLIVPGVIYLIRTSMANYLLISNPKMKASTALSASNKVMSGKTGAYFSLCMSLIGWYVLGVLTLGLGFIFIMPYTNLVKAVYYKRNLQGDKTVYNTVVQPVVAPEVQQAMSQGQTAQMQYTAQDATSAQPIVEQNAVGAEPVQQGPAPIDVLADEDFNDMQAAMRDFDNDAPTKQSVDIPEIPIVPVTSVKPSGTSETVNPTPVNTNVSNEGLSHKIDGTDLVATERILTTQEMNVSAEVKKEAYSKIDGGYVSSRPIVDYISAQANQSDDDFGVPDDFGTTEATAGNTDSAEFDEPVMSDNEFAEFLKNFDDVPESEKEFTPLKRSEKADTSNRAAEHVRHQAQPHNVASNSSAHHATGGAADLADRAARIRREREERLNKINK